MSPHAPAHHESVSKVVHYARPHIRLAKANEGSLLYKLYLASGKSPLEGVDWSVNCSPYWLIAETEYGKALGCLQMRPSQPIGMLELLSIPLETSRRVRAQVTVALITEARRLFRQQGIQVFAFGIDARYHGFIQVATRRGAVPWFTASTFLARS